MTSPKTFNSKTTGVEKIESIPSRLISPQDAGCFGRKMVVNSAVIKENDLHLELDRLRCWNSEFFTVAKRGITSVFYVATELYSMT